VVLARFVSQRGKTNGPNLKPEVLPWLGVPNVPKYYALLRGLYRGIYYSWEECEWNVKGFSDAKFKSFRTYGDAINNLNVGG
jgi:hypothetical protein